MRLVAQWEAGRTALRLCRRVVCSSADRIRQVLLRLPEVLFVAAIASHSASVAMPFHSIPALDSTEVLMARPNSDRHPGIATHSVDHTGRAQRKAKHHRASRKATKLAAKKLASQEA